MKYSLLQLLKLRYNSKVIIYKKNELWRKVNETYESIKKYRSSNKNIEDLLIDKKHQIIKILETAIHYNDQMLDFINQIKNIESLLKLYFMDFNNIANFLSTNIGITDFKIAVQTLDLKFQAKIDQFHLMFNNHFEDRNILYKIHIIFIIVFSLYPILNVNKNELILNNYKKNVLEIFKEMSESHSPPFIGEVFTIIMYCYIDCLTLDELLDIDQEILSCFKTYIEGKSNLKNDWTLVRLIEKECIRQLWTKKNNKKLFHYTNLEGLYYIFKTNSLKFTKITNLNDFEENKLLGSSTKNDVYSFSFTSKKDDVSLFGIYTNFDGISLEFDTLKVMRSLNGLHFHHKNNNNSFIHMDFNHIKYTNNAVSEVQKVTENIMASLKPFCEKSFLEEKILKSKQLLAYFYKKEPWSYESEYRIAMNIPEELKQAEILSGAWGEDDSVFLNINPNSLIKKIIIGPKILNSEFQKNNLKNILKRFDPEGKIKIEHTSAQINLKNMNK